MINFNAYAPSFMPMSQYYAGMGFGGYGSVFDLLPIGYNRWIRPQTFITNIYEERKPDFQARKIYKRSGKYSMVERNGREVEICALTLTDMLFVNPNPDRSFDCFSCMIKIEGENDIIPIEIPYKDLMRHNIPPYLPPELRRNPDCPDSYITKAFFEELLNGDDTKFLKLPDHAGWNQFEESVAESMTESEKHPSTGQYYFASEQIIIPHLSSYYPPEIAQRKLLSTDKSLAEAAADLKACMPDEWEWKSLFTTSTSSLLLPWYDAAGVKHDKITMVQIDNEPAAKTAAVLLSTQNYISTATCLLSESKTILQNTLDGTRDGNAVFRDDTYLANRKRREAGMNVLLQDLQRGQGIDENSPHTIFVITDDAGSYSSELPLIVYDLTGKNGAANIPRLQRAVGIFHAALIRVMATSDLQENPVTWIISQTDPVEKTIQNQGLTGTEYIIRCTALLLQKYGILSRSDRMKIVTHLQTDSSEFLDSKLPLADRFCKTLSGMIVSKKLEGANQYTMPYFSNPKRMYMIDEAYVNLMIEPINSVIECTKTQASRNAFLSALKESGKLHSNNNYKRLLKVKTGPKAWVTLNFYSIPIQCLTESCQREIGNIRQFNCLFRVDDLPDGMIPLVKVNDSFAAGWIINENTDEANSIFVSGKTRSGKNGFVVNYSVILAANDQNVIVLDQTGAFEPDELHKFLPYALISEYFCYWDLGKEGFPVNILSSENCSTPQAKKDRLFGILSVAARITGEVQGKILKRHLSKILKAIDAGKIKTLPDIVKFFDESEFPGHDDPELTSIVDRFRDVFEGMEELPFHDQTWEEFLSTHKKIIIISTSADEIKKDAQQTEILLTDLYHWKQSHKVHRMTVVIDELEDLSLERNGPISTILRKGGKHRLFMLLSSQEHSIDSDLLGKLIGNCGMLVFFRPKDANLAKTAKFIGCDQKELETLMQGEMIIKGGLLDRSQGINVEITLKGKTYPAMDYLNPEPPAEPEPDDIEFEESQPEPQDISFLLPEASDLEKLPPEDALSQESPLLSSMQSPETDDVTEEAHQAEMTAPASSDTILPEPDHAEPEESPSETPDSLPAEVTSPDADEEELQHQFQQILYEFDPDNPYFQSDLNDLLTQILEKHHFANPNQREHLQWRFESLIAYCNSGNYLAFCEEWKCIFNILWPSVNANI